MSKKQLSTTAKDVVSRSILAADESSGTIKKRLATIGLESTPEINRTYRELLFTTPGIEKYVSGVILFDETIRQTAKDGTPFPALLANKGIVPGIKVDKGTVTLPGQSLDTFTQGIDDLGKRLAQYREMGARFAKWRAVYTISDDKTHPKFAAIERNAHDLALYAALCQENDLVPIVEPEVLMEGSHTQVDCAVTTEKVLSEVFGRLKDYHVSFSGMILKPNMVTSGSKADNQADVEAVALSTLDALRSSISADVSGIAFLSGGQSPDLATEHLNAINKIRNQHPSQYPWRITASFGRALQDEALKTWSGYIENVVAAQGALLARAEKVYKASKGEL